MSDQRIELSGAHARPASPGPKLPSAQHAMHPIFFESHTKSCSQWVRNRHVHPEEECYWSVSPRLQVCVLSERWLSLRLRGFAAVGRGLVGRRLVVT